MMNPSPPTADESPMSRTLDEIIAYRPLYQSKLVELRDYRCCAHRSGPAGEEFSDINQIVLMRHGAFCKHFGRRQVAADVNQVVFFAKDSTYRISHPAECGDRGTIFLPAADVLAEMARQFDPSVEDRPDRPFAFVTGPCDTALFCRHRELVRRLEDAAGEPLDSLSIDETVLSLPADVLEAAFATRRAATAPPRRHRGRSRGSRRGGQSLSRALLGRAGDSRGSRPRGPRLAVSPVRVFRERTGLPIHRYLTRLRLRAARMAGPRFTGPDGPVLGLGFSSHSHFTSAFRAEFGQTPSSVRREHGPARLRQMSKNLEV